MSEAVTVDSSTIQDAREKMRQRLGQVGSKKGVSRTNQRQAIGGNAQNTPSTTVEKVKFAMKKIGMQNFELVDELAFHMNDNKCMVFKQPKVSIAAHSNCTKVTGNYEISEGSTQMLDLLNKIKMMPQVTSQFANASDKNDENIPELVEDFEAVSDSKAPAKATNTTADSTVKEQE